MITTTTAAYTTCPHCGKHAVIHTEHLHNTWWHLTPTGLTYPLTPTGTTTAQTGR